MGHYFPGPDSELEKGKLDERLVYAMFMLSYAIRDLIHLVLALDEKPAKNIQMRKHSVNWKAKYNKEWKSEVISPVQNISLKFERIKIPSPHKYSNLQVH